MTQHYSLTRHLLGLVQFNSIVGSRHTFFQSLSTVNKSFHLLSKAAHDKEEDIDLNMYNG